MIIAQVSLADIWPQSGQTIRFDYISLIYLAVIAIAVLLGIKKGLIGSLLSLFGVALAIGAAYWLCRPFGGWLHDLNGWGSSMTSGIYGWLEAKTSDVAYVLNRSQAESALPALLGSLGIPSIFDSWVSSFVLSSIPASGATEAVGMYIASAVSSLAFTAIGFTSVFVAALIVVAILSHFAKGLNKIKIIGPLNRVLGGLVGIVIGAVFVAVISFGLAALAGIGGFSDWLNSVLYLNDPTVWTFGKMIYEQNFLGYMLGLFQSSAAVLPF